MKGYVPSNISLGTNENVHMKDTYNDTRDRCIDTKNTYTDTRTHA